MKPEQFDPSLTSAGDILQDVIRQVGYPSPADLGDDIRKELERATDRCLELVRPACRYDITPILRLEKGLLVARDVGIRSTRWVRLTKRLREPEVICCFVVTTGQELERAIHEGQRDSLFHAYLLDSAGSVITERLADQVERHIADRLAAEGYQATARFSPGYCDWDLREGQEALFRFLKPESIGVRRTSGGMMVPRKTISAALVGARQVGLRSPCPFCPKGDCPYRRADAEPYEGGAGPSREACPRESGGES
jgi:hypothetical protein